MKHLPHRIVTSVAMLASLSACTPSQPETEMQPFAHEEHLTTRKKEMNEIIAPDFLMVKDSALFVISSRNDTMLYMYSLPTLSLRHKSGTKGQSKDEFALFPLFCRSTSPDLYIWGYTPFTIKRFSLPSGNAPTFIRDYRLPRHESFNQMHILHDSILVYSAIPGEFALKKISLNQGEETGRIELETEEHGESFFYESRGILAANGRYIVYAYCLKKQIDIYDASTLRLHVRLKDSNAKTLIHPGDFENTRYYYAHVIAGQEYIYALCNDLKDGYALEVFDYEGRSVARYTFDIAPSLFDIDEKQGIIYGYNDELEDFFLTYPIHTSP